MKDSKDWEVAPLGLYSCRPLYYRNLLVEQLDNSLHYECFYALFQRYNLAGFLINIVFSSLFLGTQIPNVSVIWRQAGPQLMYGMVVAWGQWVVALVVTGALLVWWKAF